MAQASESTALRRAIHKELNTTRAIVKRLIDQRLRDLPAAAPSTARTGPGSAAGVDIVSLKERVREIGDEISTVLGGDTVRQVRELLSSWERRFKDMNPTDIRLVLDELFKLTAYTALRKGKSSTTGKFNPELYSLKGVSGQSKSTAEYRRLIQSIVVTFCHRIASRLLGEMFRYPADREELVTDGDLERMANEVAGEWDDAPEQREARKQYRQERMNEQAAEVADQARRQSKSAKAASKAYNTESQQVGAHASAPKPVVAPKAATPKVVKPAAAQVAAPLASQVLKPAAKPKAKKKGQAAADPRYGEFGGEDKAFWSVVGYTADEDPSLDVDAIYEALQERDAFEIGFERMQEWMAEEGIRAAKVYKDYGKTAKQRFKELAAQERADEDYVAGRPLGEPNVEEGFQEID